PRTLRPVSQPVSMARVPSAFTPRLVPPTAVSNGSDAGKSADGEPRLATSSPESPDEKYTPMPSSTALMAIWWNALTSLGAMSSPRSPYEFDAICARWLATTVLSALSRLMSRQSDAPTYRMFASGAIACTASTSSVCSPYQPAASHWSGGSSCGLV